jgi:hypothetical protein
MDWRCDYHSSNVVSITIPDINWFSVGCLGNLCALLMTIINAKLGKWRISCLKWLDIMELWHGLHCYWLYQNHISHSVHRFQLYNNAHGFMPKSKLCMWAPVCHVHDGFVECKVIGTIFQRVNEQEYDNWYSWVNVAMWGKYLIIFMRSNSL